MAGQVEPHDEPQRNVHLYHCDHRGLPLALITPDNTVAWRAEYDEWGNLSGEESLEHLEQLIRLPGQQYDVESGLYYNRNRYYNPGQGRYITQDPIGLNGGINLYSYGPNPLSWIDPLGLSCKPTKYHKRTVSEVARLRRNFERSGGVRERFLKSLSKAPDALSKWGADAVEKMSKGKLPDNMHRHAPPGLKSCLFQPVALEVQAGML